MVGLLLPPDGETQVFRSVNDGDGEISFAMMTAKIDIFFSFLFSLQKKLTITIELSGGEKEPGQGESW